MIEAATGGRAGSLLDEIDRSVTPMGSRLIRAWLLRPLLALERIPGPPRRGRRFAFRATERAKVRETLKTIHDVERLVGRAALGTAGPRDLVSLRQSIAAIPRVRVLLGEMQAPLVRSLLAEIDDLADIRDDLARTLLDEPPAVARRRHDPRWRGRGASCAASAAPASNASPRWKKRSARTGIGSLKIRYNRVFGYYIEISKSNLPNVPPDYHRKQTIAGGEAHHTGAEGV